jgi:GTPase SAR1 family protein
MPIDATCLVVGKRHSGKTTLMTDIMYHMRERLDFVIGMNGTENRATPTLGRFLPQTFVYDHYNEEKVKHLMDWQRRAVANGRAMKAGLIRTCSRRMIKTSTFSTSFLLLAIIIITTTTIIITTTIIMFKIDIHDYKNC